MQMSNTLKTSFCLVCFTVVSLLFAAFRPEVDALELTSQQINMLQQLSASEKATLAESLGVGSPSNSVSQSTQVNEPLVVPPRDVGSSAIEESMQQVDDPKTIDSTSLQNRIEPFGETRSNQQQEDAPETTDSNSMRDGLGKDIERTNIQQQGEVVDVRKAFADITKDASLLRVSTDIKQFGYELFAGNPDTFAPATDIPVPSEYVLGPGDEIKVHFYGRDDQEFTVVVDREGEIAFPSLGALAVSGMSFVEAKAMIAQQVKQKLVGVTVDVSMGKLRSIRVFALGDVARPGSYTVSGLSSISHALFVSGGIKKTGSLRNIQLKRRGEIVTSIDLYDFLLQGDTSKDVRLLPGDVVFVPPVGVTVGVAGQVLRPAIYELKNGGDVSGLLKMAGGLLPKAYRKMALIERIDREGGRSTFKLSLENPTLKMGLENGDLLKIFSVTDYENNPVYLVGHVKRPGKYAWHDKMTLVEILPSLDDLLPEAKLDYAVIERETGVNREATMLHFNLREVLEGKQTLALQPRDKVYIFARADLRQMPVVKISGSVQQPGSFEKKKNMRLLDLLMVAGGAGRDADLSNVELLRLDPQTNKTVTHRYAIGTMHTDVPGGFNSANIEIAMSNPLLDDLDEVVVHSINEKYQRQYVHIAGEIHHPGDYVLGENMHLAELVFAAGNVTEKAYLKVAEVTRYQVIANEKREVSHFPVNLFDALQGNAEENIILEPYDVITVRQISNWRNIEHVKLSGEIVYPGTYPIEEGEHLSSVLKRAGGFTDKAYLQGAVFIRNSILLEQKSKLDEMAKRVEEDVAQQESSMMAITDPKSIAKRQASLNSAKEILAKMRQAKATGRLVVNLSNLSELSGKEYDVIMRDGDQLILPMKADEVLVMGQVYNNTALLYNSSFGWKDYIEMSGGVTRLADAGRIYVMRSNGMVERVKGGWNSTVISPGDAIIVPQDLDKLKIIESALDWSQVLYQLGVSIASMKTIGIL